MKIQFDRNYFCSLVYQKDFARAEKYYKDFEVAREEKPDVFESIFTVFFLNCRKYFDPGYLEKNLEKMMNVLNFLVYYSWEFNKDDSERLTDLYTIKAALILSSDKNITITDVKKCLYVKNNENENKIVEALLENKEASQLGEMADKSLSNLILKFNT